MARKGGRSGRKLAEWLIVEVARNTGEDYIIRPPMDAMKAHTDSKKFWEAVVWNGQHNEAQFRLAMAGATGLTDVFVESLPFLSDFVRDQSQEVLEQLINSLLIYCKKQEKLPESPKPELAIDELVKSIPARFGEGWKTAAVSMQEKLGPLLGHITGLGGPKATDQQYDVFASSYPDDVARLLEFVARLPADAEDDWQRVNPTLPPVMWKALLDMEHNKAVLAIRRMAKDTTDEVVQEVLSGVGCAINSALDEVNNAIDRRRAAREPRQSSGQPVHATVRVVEHDESAIDVPVERLTPAQRSALENDARRGV